LHRVDGPALIYPNGTKEYYQDGQLHRMDGPAIEHADGTKEYYQNNLRHREDGPAVCGSESQPTFYYQEGKLHREASEGPAAIYPSGRLEFYQDGQLIKRVAENKPAQ
jgi:hypothetical protein